MLVPTSELKCDTVQTTLGVKELCDKFILFGFIQKNGRQQKPEHGTFRNIPEHSGTFRNIPEHPGPGQIITKQMKKNRKKDRKKAIKETTKKRTNKQTNNQ